MAYKLLVYMAILKLAICDPVPDPDNININVLLDVNVYGKMETGLSTDNDDQNDCTFGSKTYSTGEEIQDMCMRLICKDKEWYYIGTTNDNCGECIVWGEPHINMFNNPERYLDFMGTGEFAISQPGFAVKPNFGIYSAFEPCPCSDTSGCSCVASATYFEPGIRITMFVSPLALTSYCKELNPPSRPAFCDISVWSGEPVPKLLTVGDSVIQIKGLDGKVSALVFRRNEFNFNAILDCMYVVGSKGFSLSLCQHSNDFAWLYVWATPPMQDNIYGLCGHPGNDIGTYTKRNQAQTNNYKQSAETWKVHDSASHPFMPTAYRCNNYTVLHQIEEKCSWSHYGYCPMHLTPFNETCVYDACRVPNYDNYLNGYASHALFHSQTSVFKGKCKCSVGSNNEGCVISEPVEPLLGKACRCVYFSLGVLQRKYCYGHDVACKNMEAPSCLNPSTDYQSCLQGQGNCGGY